MSVDVAAQARAYTRFWETLAPESSLHLPEFVVPDVEFRDPLNQVRGIGGMAAIIAKTFHDLDHPQFIILNVAVTGQMAFIGWTFNFRRKGWGGGAQWSIDGVSEVHFNDAGLVTRHIDHWDAASEIYERLPVVGAVIRFIRRWLTVEGHSHNMH